MKNQFKFVSLFILIAVLAVSLAACGGAAAPAADSGAAAPAASEATTAPAADSGAMGQAVFTNTGSLDICQLFLSHVSKNEWGPNQLAADQKIVAGDKYTVTNVPVGMYDAKAVGCDGTSEAVVQLEIK